MAAVTICRDSASLYLTLLSRPEASTMPARELGLLQREEKDRGVLLFT